jgi:hypothetical protein
MSRSKPKWVRDELGQCWNKDGTYPGAEDIQVELWVGEPWDEGFGVGTPLYMWSASVLTPDGTTHTRSDGGNVGTTSEAAAKRAAGRAVEVIVRHLARTGKDGF